ncbi:class I SAM-dependent methyltransferase [Embleya sp. NPDC056575]|uniref:class I SAM-dependent methyltransferase n=1 Tax=unclassified Embleya TaxID=2699296 RepID=UPI003694844A
MNLEQRPTAAPRPPAHTPAQRRHLGSSFDRLAEHYTAGRPTYPAEFVRALVQPLLDRTDAPRTVLEVGAGTGQATGVLPRLFEQVTTMEPGHRLAEETRRRFTDDTRITVHRSSLEDWTETSPYDCVFSASAFHWADPHISYTKAHTLLRPTGRLALVSYGDVLGEHTWEEPAERIREMYRRSAPGLTPPFGSRRVDDLRSALHLHGQSIARALEYFEFGNIDAVAEIPVADWFTPTTIHIRPHNRSYTGEQLVAALRSYGGFRDLEDNHAHRLAQEIRAYVEDECANRLLRPLVLVGLAADRLQDTA